MRVETELGNTFKSVYNYKYLILFSFWLNPVFLIILMGNKAKVIVYSLCRYQPLLYYSGTADARKWLRAAVWLSHETAAFIPHNYNL